ncbi:hypothetical protein [Aquimarina aggregata]|uniref:hypothetical protein n=1 Tax=Aquimarina aggregata TaxID=1642818 RepID=UPI000A44FE72|nr:hypothetical protein [Aquimarina aggregata]
MKTLKYVLLAVLLGINLISCEAPPLNEEVGIEEVEVEAFLTEDGQTSDETNPGEN